MISNTPTITINDLTLFDYTYRWHVPTNARICNVIMRGAGGGGAGGESLVANTYHARPPLRGQPGGSTRQCIFSLRLDTNKQAFIDLVVGKGGKGGAPSSLGSSGSVSQFGKWVTINGGFPGSFSAPCATAQVIWSDSPLLQMSSICEIDPIYGAIHPNQSSGQAPFFASVDSNEVSGGTGGDGANGVIQIDWF